ncbi:MAG: hypothetical protein PHC70_01455 [Patescibacteria group bacterium]|nr:hypothetical protein [Patescibacteria group bacterium]
MKDEVLKVQRVVKRIRLEFEKKRVSKIKLKNLYFKYNPVINVISFIKEAEKLFPKLNCGLTSVYLKNVLGGEVIQGKYGQHKHTFLLLNDQVVDITADQYGGPKVYIGELRYPWSKQ